MKAWQLQEAKARFSEVLRIAGKHGAQPITVRGEVEAYVISRRDYERLHAPKEGFVSFMRNSPLCGIELDIQRDRSLTRSPEEFS